MDNNWNSDEWYKNLKKAPWQPPNYVFGIVWPILYVLMTISYIIIAYSKKCNLNCKELNQFYLQLILNLIWTPVFRYLKAPKIALFILILLLILCINIYIIFYPINIIASILFIPYILWLCVAFSLNTYIVLYN